MSKLVALEPICTSNMSNIRIFYNGENSGMNDSEECVKWTFGDIVGN